MKQFPFASSGGPAPQKLPPSVGDPTPWYGDIGNILEVQKRLNCRPFAWFLHRFSAVYKDGGLVPAETFLIRHSKSKKCLRYGGNEGTAPQGYGHVSLEPCSKWEDRQRWHHANADPFQGGKCCSSLRAWNTDQCLARRGRGEVDTSVCDISGERNGIPQRWSVSDEGLMFWASNTRYEGECLVASRSKAAKKAGRDITKLSLKSCQDAKTKNGIWEKIESAIPLETKLYTEAIERHPEWTQ